MPLAFLASGLGRAVLAGLAIALLGAALYFQIKANGRLAGDRDHVVQVNKDNQAVIAAKDAETARASQIAADEHAAAEAWRKRFNSFREKIANAKPEDDGPVARVLRSVLDSLPEQHRDQTGADPAIAGAGGAHDLSGRPGAAAP